MKNNFYILILIFIVKAHSILWYEGAPMHHIIDNIYLGDIRAAKNYSLLSSNKITHVINCPKDISNYYYSRNIKYLKLNLDDKDGQNLFPALDTGFDFIKNSTLSGYSNILVHCHGGVSRSTSLVIYYIMKTRKWSFQEALKFVKDRRECVAPIPPFRKQLIQKENDTFLSVVKFHYLFKDNNN